MHTTLDHLAALARPEGPSIRPDQPTLASHRSWPRWSALGAAIWSAAYGCLGVWWIGNPAGFPFGVGPSSGPASSLWAGLRPALGAPVVAVLGFAGAAAAVLMSRTPPNGALRAPLRAFAAAMTALLVLVPDARVLAVAAYGIVFLAGAPFGWPPMSFWGAIPRPLWYQLGCVVGGMLWGATSLAFFRLTRGACVAWGRRATPARGSSPAPPARWGTWGIAAAVVAPLTYATSRLAWVVGIPLGISESLLRDVRSHSMWNALGLACVAIGGAILTVGLGRPWGAVFPRWIPFLRGRRVPVALALVPATFVAMLVFAAGLGIARSVLHEGFSGDRWPSQAPGLLWPFWGIGLATATLAYYYRRRGRCRRCRRP
jgi:hypothetical protein